jgi:teichuronic acid biosynthesis glycosyltransferase TuaC
MNVLVLSHLFPPFGGTFVLEQMKALRDEGMCLETIAPTPWPPPFLRSRPRLRRYAEVPPDEVVAGFKIRHPRFACLPRAYFFYLLGLSMYLRCRPLVRRLTREKSIQVIHAHTVMPDGFAAACLGLEFDLPVVCTVRGSDINLYPSRNRPTLWATKWALTHITRLVAVSDDLKNKALELSNGGSVHVLHNGADPSVFRPTSKTETRKQLGLPSQGSIILFIGNLVPEKGVEFLLGAIAQLRPSHARLFLIGDGELRDSLRAYATSLGIDGMCTFIGSRPHDQIPYWLGAADCLVVSSLSEGLPTVLPEAMLCRTPIVATTVGGIPEVIRNNKTGLLVPPRNPSALAAALGMLLMQPETAARMAAEAEHIARASLTWKAHAQELVKVYADVVRCFSKRVASLPVKKDSVSSLPASGMTRRNSLSHRTNFHV